MDWKFFGKWWDTKRPMREDRNPGYDVVGEAWNDMCPHCRAKIVEASRKARIQGFSFIFWLFVAVAVVLIARSLV